MSRRFHVYILASRSRRLYVGVTGSLTRRIAQHRNGEIKGFSKKYQMVRLVYVEETTDPGVAIRREKQIKGWLRRKKLDLIESLNPEWRDLAENLPPSWRRGEILRCAQDDNPVLRMTILCSG
jgi:putative endonuclease